MIEGKYRIFSAFITALLAVFLYTPFITQTGASGGSLGLCPVSNTQSCSRHSGSCDSGEPGIINKANIDPIVIPSFESATVQVSQNPSIIPSNQPPSGNGGTLNSDLIFDLINQHRQSIGLPPLQKDANLCAIAQSRTAEMPGEVANGTLHAGLYRRNLPYWITENMKYGGNEQETVDWWLHSPIHRAAIEGNYKYACGACIGNTCDELFTNYTPK